MALLVWLMTRWLTGDGQMPVLVWVGGLLLGVGLPLVGWGLAGHALQDIARPLADLMDAADAVARAICTSMSRKRVPAISGRSAQTSHRMEQELERAEEQRRNLAADVAHEPRMPLHIIQGTWQGCWTASTNQRHSISTPCSTNALAGKPDRRPEAPLLAESGQLVLHKEAIAVDELLPISRPASVGRLRRKASSCVSPETTSSQG